MNCLSRIGARIGARTLARALAWPGVVAGGLGVHFALAAAGVPVQGSAYLAVALGALAVTGLERALPYRTAWRPGRGEVATDLAYLALVQTALPVALALSVAAGLGALLDALGFAPAALWPGGWPIAAQALLMLVVADGLRWTMHVAAHHWEPLWRLHAVHHAPQRLYWLNVARFHPLEKALQYGLDALPFVLLGVAPEVLALYFVFYAINGFFQHSNVDVRLGWLNHLVAGPELHRWHHSRRIEESNANYGNNLIVFDHLFGTRFLPAGAAVGELGLENRYYPTRLGAQLRAPFAPGLDRAPTPLPAWSDLAARALLALRMAWLGATAWPRLRRAARRPAASQRAVLLRLLARNRDTHFGRAHGFDAIRSIEDYRRAVPVQDYEALRPYVEAQAEGEPALTREPPVLYAQTSGTTGAPKYLPLLARSLRANKRLQALYAWVQYRAVPGAFAGRILGIVSPAVEGRLPSGAPFGSASGHIYRHMPRAARARYVLPAEVFAIEDYELKYRLILRLALVVEDITTVATANPSTLQKLLEVLAREREALLRDIERGDFAGLDDLAPAVRDAVRPRLACSPERLAALREILGRPRPDFAALWPRLRLVSTWTGGSCGIALESVRRALPADCVVSELGYLASEVRGTVTVALEGQLGLPALQDTFFEFVTTRDWEAGEPRFLGLEELEEGRDYYVIVTTDAGLYRYAMNDIVRVTGRFQSTPTLAFVQKGKGVTSITGEKLYEGQVLEAVTGALEDEGLCAPFFVALACPEEARYRLLVELPAGDASGLAERVDAHLAEINLEYAAKRKSGRLGALTLCVLRAGAADAYRRACVARGQREGQWKTLALQPVDDFDFDWQAWTR